MPNTATHSRCAPVCLRLLLPMAFCPRRVVADELLMAALDQNLDWVAELDGIQQFSAAGPEVADQEGFHGRTPAPGRQMGRIWMRAATCFVK